MFILGLPIIKRKTLFKVGEIYEYRNCNYTKKLSKNLVLENINLSLSGGKIYGFVGKNGSGKTMLMRAIAVLILPTSGL